MNESAVAVLGTPRRARRWTDAVTLLRNFALITFDVDPMPPTRGAI